MYLNLPELNNIRANQQCLNRPFCQLACIMFQFIGQDCSWLYIEFLSPINSTRIPVLNGLIFCEKLKIEFLPIYLGVLDKKYMNPILLGIGIVLLRIPQFENNIPGIPFIQSLCCQVQHFIVRPCCNSVVFTSCNKFNVVSYNEFTCNVEEGW